MKKILLIIVTILLALKVNAQIVDIPDANFKYTLVNFPCVDTNDDGYGDSDADINDDGEIQVVEAEMVLGLYFLNRGILSLEGIQSFVNLESFHFGSDDITSVDLTHNTELINLHIGSIPISTIDLSHNINLTSLYISNTLITDLDLSHNNQLNIINLSHNDLTNLNISQCINLIELACTYSPLTEIDVSQNIELEYIWMWYNQLTSIDISQLDNLISISLYGNQLSELNVSNSLNLVDINCSNNQIQNLDFSLNSNLNRVNCENNTLSFLNLKNGNTNSISRLIAFGNPNLTCIQVDDVEFANSQVCKGSNDGNWCKDETAIYSEDCSLGLNESLETHLSIYPNPAKDVLMLYNESESYIEAIKIYDVLGKLVLEQSNPSNQIDISNLSSGLLLVQIETNNGTITKKVIKE